MIAGEYTYSELEAEVARLKATRERLTIAFYEGVKLANAYAEECQTEYARYEFANYAQRLADMAKVALEGK